MSSVRFWFSDFHFLCANMPWRHFDLYRKISSSFQLVIRDLIQVIWCEKFASLWALLELFNFQLFIALLGIKPYSCFYCSKTFSRSDHLKKHIKIHEKKMKDGKLKFRWDEIPKQKPGRKKKVHIEAWNDSKFSLAFTFALRHQPTCSYDIIKLNSPKHQLVLLLTLTRLTSSSFHLLISSWEFCSTPISRIKKIKISLRDERWWCSEEVMIST